MKRPYINQEKRLALHWYREGTYNSLLGTSIELELSWKKLLREIKRTIFKKK